MAILWPLTGRINSGYGDTKNRPGPHWAIDIGGTGAIRAGATGVVHHVGPNPAGPNSGNVVTIKYSTAFGLLYAMYCHVQARYPVRVGQTVHAGNIIAYVGFSGTGDGAHVHIECYLNGRNVNPTRFFGGTVPASGDITPITPDTPIVPRRKKNTMSTVYSSVVPSPAPTEYVEQGFGPGQIIALAGDGVGEAAWLETQYLPGGAELVSAHNISDIAVTLSWDTYVDWRNKYKGRAPVETSGSVTGGAVDLTPVLTAIGEVPTAEQNGQAARTAIVKP